MEQGQNQQQQINALKVRCFDAEERLRGADMFIQQIVSVVGFKDGTEQELLDHIAKLAAKAEEAEPEPEEEQQEPVQNRQQRKRQRQRRQTKDA